MTEEHIFLAALDLDNPADIAAYLEKACGGDLELRRQVERLLAAHFKNDPFLDEPVATQFEVDGAPPAGAVVPPHAPAPGNAVPDTQANGLPFLQSPTRADSLGRIGHYEVFQVLGQGGFGIVLRGFDDVLQRVVALKVLAPALAATSPARKRFLREAQASAQVRHENIVQVYAVEEQPLPYLVMEFIPGETLQQRLDRTGPLDVADIVRFGRQIAEGLAAAHATGLIHRDIKPGNVLIEGGHQRVKITDFGLARAADDASMTQSGVLAGTPMYMAPEQARGEALDHRADLFSLGSVLYVMASGRPPFRAATTYAVLKRVIEDNPRPIRELIPEMPQWLCDIIARLQAKKPQDRYQSAREVADAFADCAAQLKANAGLENLSPLPRRQPAAARSSRWQGLAAAALFLVVATVGVTEIAGITNWLWVPPRAVDPLQDRAGDGVPRSRPEDQGLPMTVVNTLGMKFKLIPAGKFRMGSPQAEIDYFVNRSKDEGFRRMVQREGPEHDVEITKPFYLGITEVTVGQFAQFSAANPRYDVGDERWRKPAFYQSDDHPVLWVSWHNAADFCTWLSDKERKEYRLPTEAEWEYSCRAGRSSTRYCYGDDDAELVHYAWIANNCGKRTHRVGEKKPNDWGLYDMHGNAFEFCQNWHDPGFYPHNSVQDPQGPGGGDLRVTRGGSWNYGHECSRCAFRSWLAPHERRQSVGFRVLLVAPRAGRWQEGGK
jgi:formylglycine-generating enzyme required for sulfatase activity